MSKRKVRRAITVKGKHGTYTAHRLVARLYLESLREVPKGTREHALARQDAASSAVGIARMDVPANPREPPTHQRDFDATLWANSTGAATSGVYSTLLRNHGLSNVSQVPQNPNKWVR
jgi:hypothetical protein